MATVTRLNTDMNVNAKKVTLENTVKVSEFFVKFVISRYYFFLFSTVCLINVFQSSEADKCHENKCLHGYCNPTLHGYECQCKEGYKGEYCQGNKT